MIQFGKETSGDLLIRITPDDVGEVLDMARSANLMQRRVFNPLQQYINANYPDDLLRYQNRKDGKPC